MNSYYKHIFLAIGSCTVLCAILARTCVCVRDVFNEVSTRLVRQAHLYDRFPPTTSRLSRLRATVPAHGYKYDDSQRINQPLQRHTPSVRKAIRAAHTSVSDINRYVRQYRGTQPHSTESTMTNNVEVRQRQSASGRGSVNIQ